MKEEYRSTSRSSGFRQITGLNVIKNSTRLEIADQMICRANARANIGTRILDEAFLIDARLELEKNKEAAEKKIASWSSPHLYHQVSCEVGPRVVDPAQCVMRQDAEGFLRAYLQRKAALQTETCMALFVSRSVYLNAMPRRQISIPHAEETARIECSNCDFVLVELTGLPVDIDGIPQAFENVVRNLLRAVPPEGTPLQSEKMATFLRNTRILATEYQSLTTFWQKYMQVAD